MTATLADIVSPTTDGGVITQAIALVLVSTAASIAVRREKSLVLLIAGIAAVLLALIGVRGLH